MVQPFASLTSELWASVGICGSCGHLWQLWASVGICGSCGPDKDSRCGLDPGVGWGGGYTEDAGPFNLKAMTEQESRMGDNV